MSSVRGLFDTPEFQAGLMAGIAALVVVVVVGAAAGRLLPRIAGAAFTVAAAAALANSARFPDGGEIPGQVWLALALSFGLTELVGLFRSHPAITGLASTPGAILIAGALDDGIEDWVRVVVVLGAVVGAACVADFDETYRSRGFAPAMLTISVAAVYLTVPETEFARTIFGAALPLFLLGWPVALAALGSGGAASSVALVVYVIGQEGSPRPGAVIGGLAAFGLFAAEPVVRRVRAPSTNPSHGSRARVSFHVLGVHIALAAASARWVGMAVDADAALLRLGILLPLFVALAVTLPVPPDHPFDAARPSKRGRRGARSDARTRHISRLDAAERRQAHERSQRRRRR